LPSYNYYEKAEKADKGGDFYAKIEIFSIKCKKRNKKHRKSAKSFHIILSLI